MTVLRDLQLLIPDVIQDKCNLLLYLPQSTVTYYEAVNRFIYKAVPIPDVLIHVPKSFQNFIKTFSI